MLKSLLTCVPGEEIFVTVGYFRRTTDAPSCLKHWFPGLQ